MKSSKPKRILVTSALPYANGPIHIGHLVEYIQTDIFVRFLKLLGEDAIYCCADDTHGTPIEINAKKQGIKPEKLIEKYHKEHQKDFADFNIEFDSYYSTNSPENKHFSDFIFTKAKEKGHIYKKDVEHTYCEKCKRFLPDRYVKGKCPKCGAEDQYGDVCEKCNSAYEPVELIDPYCSICRSKPVVKSSDHYFFKLSTFSDKLKQWIEKNERIQPEARNFVLNWIKEGLKDWDITRDGPYFGFKIPGEENKYYYVWLDAPIGYISSTDNYCKTKGKSKGVSVEDYWNKEGSTIIHFIGKDIIYFHFLFWPAVLMAADFNLPDHLVVHGFLTVKKTKMSKSRGTLLTAREYLSSLNPEYLRFYYAASLSHKISDIDLDIDDFKDKINNELVANIANLAYRTLNFINKNFDSKLADVKAFDEGFAKQFHFDRIIGYYNTYEFREAVKLILHYSSLGNKYFQENEPWKLIENDRERARRVTSLCANLVKNLCILLKPVIPKFSEKLEKQLNLKNLTFKDLNFDLGEHKISTAKPLVKKIDDELKVFAGDGGEEKEKTSDFQKLTIKVAKITSVEDHPDADKLYVFKIDLGDEKRQLVAGIKDWYKKEELQGKNIVVLTNLQTAKLRGIESKGMLLACEDKEKNIGLLVAPNSNPGDYVSVEGEEVNKSPPELSFKDFGKISNRKLAVKDGKPLFNEKVFKTDSEEVIVEKVKKGRVC